MRRFCTTILGSNSGGFPVSTLNIRKVAVLGAGVMGAQIAAHLINARVPVILFDLPAKEGAKNGIAMKAIENLKKLSPAPLGVQRSISGPNAVFHMIAPCGM